VAIDAELLPPTTASTRFGTAICVGRLRV